jgi:hypothetical protein
MRRSDELDDTVFLRADERRSAENGRWRQSRGQCQLDGLMCEHGIRVDMRQRPLIGHVEWPATLEVDEQRGDIGGTDAADPTRLAK